MAYRSVVHVVHDSRKASCVFWGKSSGTRAVGGHALGTAATSPCNTTTAAYDRYSSGCNGFLRDCGKRAQSAAELVASLQPAVVNLQSPSTQRLAMAAMPPVRHRSRSTCRDHRPEAVRVVMRQAMNRSWRKLAEERFQDVRPTIPLGKRFWPLSPGECRSIRRLFG
jgi:hypothetical protein